ncbi:MULTISPECIES: RPA family protein [Halolamina]|uniref:Rpa-associated protein n=1 Tax=Halolamina pelagica TaxID=699431 RepID=A0A1I5MJ32_9EURY|nr:MULTISPECIES: hypothetical protein [Halolamina]NHX36040.1 hypothetical protein [Halolamina sp. R1-12]SFP09307.1 hypothetical protein SAMN05216277_101284 [Halolamina pelagica]
MSADSGPGNREIARRLFAAEFDDASLSYSESDEERAPNYVVTPTGARVNRLFAVGVLTEVEQVNEDSLRGRVVDPTGAFVTYAGQYQPDEHAFLNRTEPPTFVALSGKARTFEPEDSDRVFTSVRPESINEVEADTRDRWVVSAAERTLHRVAIFAEALDSDLRGEELRAALETATVDASLAAGIPKAIDHYGTGTVYLEAVRSLAVEAVEQVAGERDSVGALETEPGAEGSAELGPLPAVDIDLDGAAQQVESATEGSTPAEADDAAGSTEDAEPVDAASTSGEADGEGTTSSGAGETDAEPETDDTTDDEPATETTAATAADEAAADSGEEELGDFDAGESVQETVENEAEDLEDFDPEETVDDEEALTESERREVKEEFGTDFSTGTEVDEPGEAGINVPTSEEELEEIESEITEEGGTTEESTAEESADLDYDLEDAVVDAMAELDDGDGADREAVVERVVEEHGADPDAVDDAIQGAMMSGKCYEPNDGTLKAI